MGTLLLEINLISAQGLKPPSANLRRLQTYAVAWVDSASKLRTRIDRVGGENPTWNDKFIFRVDTDFLCSETSAVAVEIYAVGYLKDPLIGTVRFLISNCISGVLPSDSGFNVPSFTALQIRRPSGRFHGILNLGCMVIKDSDFAALTGVSAIDYRDLMGENHRRPLRRRKDKSKRPIDEDHSEQSCGDSADCSDGADSSTSSSSTTSTVLKNWNGRRNMAGNKDLISDGKGLLCGLGFQRKIHLSPSDQNFQISIANDENKN